MLVCSIDVLLQGFPDEACDSRQRPKASHKNRTTIKENQLSHQPTRFLDRRPPLLGIACEVRSADHMLVVGVACQALYSIFEELPVPHPGWDDPNTRGLGFADQLREMRLAMLLLIMGQCNSAKDPSSAYAALEVVGTEFHV